MGRIKTMLIKRSVNRLIKEHKDKLKPDFDQNKEIVVQFMEIRSKKLRNVIAGYATRLMKQED